MTRGDLGGAAERLSVAVRTDGLREYITVATSFNVKRYDEDQTRWAMRRLGFGDTRPLLVSRGITPVEFASVGGVPYSETQEDNCNMVVQQGWVWLFGGVVTSGTAIPAKFSATNGRIGVGTSATAAAYAQT